ncbi:MAG: PEGA domain-containing protein [Acidobacteriota bacterium]
MLTGAVVLLGGGALYLLMSPPAVQGPSTAPSVSWPKATPPDASASRSSKPEPRTTRPAAPKAPKTEVPVAAAVDAAPTTGTLRIVADVPEASVFIDRKFVGTAPVTANDIAPGSHHLNVSAPGYDAVSEDLEVVPGPRDVSIKFKEVRLAATLQVTHKHAMGSCAGTLKASPQGVTYDTTNKGDAFTVALTDIESFEVDYLSKNLKLKVKKGKTYNFTDPDGNADRLFVFHRDVDKVRQRLSEGK